MPMNVLIVDDHESNRILVKYLLESEGHHCIEAGDGQEALKQFREYKPDFVLLDIVMPVMDGYEAARLIKKEAGETHVPIIFLTAKHDEASLLKCLESGGDDYLPKPINGIILKAKIKAHARTQELTQQVHAKNAELTRLHATLTQEHEMGRHVLNHTLKRSLNNCPNVKSYLSSMSMFNGDIFLLAENPSGGLYAFLGDFTGHGLAAAIGTVPVSQVFFSMCEKSMPVMEIASSMNRALKSFLPEYMFCAATLVHITEDGDRALVWSGGLPDAYIVRPGKGVVKTLKSRHMPLGIQSHDAFNSEVDLYELEENDRFLFFTDGVLEGTPSDSDEMFGEQRVQDSLNKRARENDIENLFDGLLSDYNDFTQDTSQQDDVSLVEITAAPVVNSPSEKMVPKTNLPWSIEVLMTPDVIRENPDPVLQIIRILPPDLFLYSRADMIRSILSELYSNALEHGLLGLRSDIKSSAEGFAKYYSDREHRIAIMKDGVVSVTVSFDYARTGRELLMVVRDTGTGFDFSLQSENMAENTKPWGRGIALVRSLCESLEFSEGGRCVSAYMSLNLSDKKDKYQQAVPE